MKVCPILAVLLTTFQAVATEITWKGGGDTLRWSDGSNWVGGVAPGAGDTAVIPDNTTAWASHYSEAKGGDLTVLDKLGGIRLNGANAVFELDCENDESSATCCFGFSTPLSGNGRFVIKNTVNNDRYVTLGADNSAFTGTFAFLDSRVHVEKNLKALGTVGNRVEVAPSLGYHGLYYKKSGVYSNDVYVLRSANIGLVGGVTAGVTNLGCVINLKAGAFALGGMYYYAVSNAVQNASSDRGSFRIGGGTVIGEGGLYGNFRSRGGGCTFTIAGPLRACGDRSNPAFLNQDGSTTLKCGAENVLNGAYLQMGTTTIDLNGYSQSGAALCGPNSAVTITSAKPATLEWAESNTTDAQTPNWTVSGQATLVHNYNWDNKQYKYNNGTSTTKGGFFVKHGKLTIDPGYTLPNVKWLGSTSASKYAKSWLFVNTAAINPGKVRLEASSVYGVIDIADGIQLDVMNFLSKGAYVKAGVYGSQAAHEAHPELVDADHVLDTLTGTGTVKVNFCGEPGLAIFVR